MEWTSKVARIELYTRQHENSIFELLKKGVITNKETYIRLHMGPDAEYFIERYRTFVQMAEILVPRPDQSNFPIWGSPSKAYCLKPEENSLVYCLEVPKEEVIYFDGLKWDYVLNYLYVPLDESDKKEHQDKLKAQQAPTGQELFSQRYSGMFPEIKKTIRDSWWRIFQVDDCDLFTLQGNIWQIKKEWITNILSFGETFQEVADRPLDLAAVQEKVLNRQQGLAENIY